VVIQIFRESFRKKVFIWAYTNIHTRAHKQSKRPVVLIELKKILWRNDVHWSLTHRKVEEKRGKAPYAQGGIEGMYVDLIHPPAIGLVHNLMVHNTACHRKLSSSSKNAPLTILWDVTHHLKRGSLEAIIRRRNDAYSKEYHDCVCCIVGDSRKDLTSCARTLWSRWYTRLGRSSRLV
jgi:hypothetical protein